MSWIWVERKNFNQLTAGWNSSNKCLRIVHLAKSGILLLKRFVPDASRQCTTVILFIRSCTMRIFWTWQELYWHNTNLSLMKRFVTVFIGSQKETFTYLQEGKKDLNNLKMKKHYTSTGLFTTLFLWGHIYTLWDNRSFWFYFRMI